MYFYQRLLILKSIYYFYHTDFYKSLATETAIYKHISLNILDIGLYVYKDLWAHGLSVATREVADNYREKSVGHWLFQVAKYGHSYTLCVQEVQIFGNPHLPILFLHYDKDSTRNN